MNRRPSNVALLVIIGLIAAVALATLALPLSAQKSARRPLATRDINDIATLLKLEDTRHFDEAELTRILNSDHPEVRRRAVMTLGRIVNENARPMLAALRGDRDAEIVATVAWAAGQQKDAGAVEWLGRILAARDTPVAVAKEAAQALGKIRSPDARTALAAFLAAAPLTASPDVVGEALLSTGRFTTKDDIAPIVRWTQSSNAQIRWRAAWALFRPRDPLAVPHLLTMSTDASPEVRFWAVRGLAATVVADSPVGVAAASARLRLAASDPDRRVRTEAIRALVGYDDDASVAAVLTALESPDTWISVSAAESLGRFTTRAGEIAPRLVAASAAGKPLALRISALAPLVALAPDAARALAASLAAENNATARNAAAQATRQLDNAARAGAAGGGRGTGGARAGGRGRGAAAAPPALVARPDADYRALVTRWIVPAYNGARAPHVVFETTRGSVDVELYPGDAPFGVEYLMAVVGTGEIAGTEFGRVVPNFVAQENAIRNTGRLRDEVNRRGLTRGNLAWASAGLDTGRPGYTLGSTPQPHNEGDFTSLGRVVNGLDVVDRLELGDKITGAKIVK